MSTPSPTPRPGVLAIEAYVPGESNLPGSMKPIKLSSNETPLGPSPAAVEAYKAAAADLERYPDGQATALRTAIERKSKVSESTAERKIERMEQLGVIKKTDAKLNIRTT